MTLGTFDVEAPRFVEVELLESLHKERLRVFTGESDRII